MSMPVRISRALGVLCLLLVGLVVSVPTVVSQSPATPVAAVAYAGRADLFDATQCGNGVYMVGFRFNNSGFLYGINIETREKLGKPISAAGDTALIQIPGNNCGDSDGSCSDPKSLVLSSDCSTAYVAGFSNDRVYVINVSDPKDAKITATIDLSSGVKEGDRPQRMPVDIALGANGLLYVVNSKEGADSVSVVDPAAKKVVTEIKVGRFPTSIALFSTASSALARGYVTNKFAGTVSVIDLNSNTVLANLTGDGPSSAAAGLATSALSLFYAYYVNGLATPPTVNRLNISTNQVDAQINVCDFPQKLIMTRTGVVAVCGGVGGPDTPPGYAVVTDNFSGLTAKIRQTTAVLGPAAIVVDNGGRFELWANDKADSLRRAVMQVYDLTK